MAWRSRGLSTSPAEATRPGAPRLIEGRTTRNALAFFHAGRPRSRTDRPSAFSREPGARDHLQLIYAARVGPDADGKIKAPIETVAPPKSESSMRKSDSTPRSAQLTPTT